MGKRKEKIYVIGHKNPDTDSICSAIAYADLRQKVTGQVHEAKRAGHVNDETAYVLDRFGVEAPKLLTDVRLQVRDLDIHEMQGLKPNASIRDTWERMRCNDDSYASGSHCSHSAMTDGSAGTSSEALRSPVQTLL